MCFMGKKSKADKLIEGRVKGLPFAEKRGKLSPKEAGVHRSMGRKSKPPAPRSSYKQKGGEERYLKHAQRDSKKFKKGQIVDNQSATLARSRDRIKSRQHTASDRR